MEDFTLPVVFSPSKTASGWTEEFTWSLILTYSLLHQLAHHLIRVHTSQPSIELRKRFCLHSNYPIGILIPFYSLGDIFFSASDSSTAFNILHHELTVQLLSVLKLSPIVSILYSISVQVSSIYTSPANTVCLLLEDLWPRRWENQIKCLSMSVIF